MHFPRLPGSLPNADQNCGIDPNADRHRSALGNDRGSPDYHN